MIKMTIFWAVIGIIFYAWCKHICAQFAESKDMSIFDVKDIIKVTDQFLLNFWVTKVLNRPFHYLVCHIQIMENMEIYTYTLYWFVHKIGILLVLHWKLKDNHVFQACSNLATYQTGAILCMIIIFVLYFPFDMKFDIQYIHFNMDFISYILFESILSFALVIGTRFLPEYMCSSFSSINVYNYVFFSNLNYTMILLCLHCIGMISFDLYVNDCISKIANVKKQQHILGQLQSNISKANAKLHKAMPAHLVASEDFKESIKTLNEQITNETNIFNKVQKSLDETTMHIQFMLVMFHMAVMFFLLSTYFTRPTCHVATQLMGKAKTPKFEPKFIEEVPAPAAGADAVGNNGVHSKEDETVKLWKVEPYHHLTCINITLLSTLTHMGLFVVTILISPRVQQLFLTYASFGMVIFKIAIHHCMPESAGNVCHMNSEKMKIMNTAEGQKTIGILVIVQNIICIYFMPWMHSFSLVVAQIVFAYGFPKLCKIGMEKEAQRPAP